MMSHNETISMRRQVGVVGDDTRDCSVGYKNENASWDFLKPIFFIQQTQRSESPAGWAEEWIRTENRIA